MNTYMGGNTQLKINGKTGAIASTYIESICKKVFLLLILLGMIFIVAVYAIIQGTYEIPMQEVFWALMGKAEHVSRMVIVNIRLPRIVAAIICGCGLSLSGLCIQSVLKNPLGSPFTLGISQGAAFGAALSMVVFDSQLFSVSTFAFGGAMSATFIILILARIKRLSPEAIILLGVALSSLFASATTLIQYLTTETQLAMIVFWTFGDVARSNWWEIGFVAAVVLPASLLLMILRWDLNSLTWGEETAKGLGVNVEKVRVLGMIAAALISALVTAFHGVIAFIGLIAPHMARRLVGEDHGLLIPFSAILGALLLLTADTLGRVLIGSGALPVGVITSFLGTPMFLYLLIRRYR
ncbi:MAG: FecCD family ABC transporter permease [Dissulfurimicrobium sp.]|uniref:FecCD family ABC transporter permease n=1 Tax=Dissulfurimicrobium sp. TaxID=2022436 RepID=UPI00404AE19F